MMATHLARQIAEDMDYLDGAWPALVELGVPGTRRRIVWRAPSQASREAEALEASEDLDARREPGWVPPLGRSAAPADVSLLDLLARFVSTASDVSETVTQCVGVVRPPAPASCWADPRPYLRTARAWLSVADDADGKVGPWVGEQLHGLADQVAARLGEVHDGQVLDAMCPWCRGRTAASPMGGEQTLVVYARQSRSDQAAGKPSETDPMIVCRGVNCTPPESAVGHWLGKEKSRPAWPLREWDWLAKQLLPVGTLVPA